MRLDGDEYADDEWPISTPWRAADVRRVSDQVRVRIREQRIFSHDGDQESRHGCRSPRTIGSLLVSYELHGDLTWRGGHGTVATLLGCGVAVWQLLVCLDGCWLHVSCCWRSFHQILILRHPLIHHSYPALHSRPWLSIICPSMRRDTRARRSHNRFLDSSPRSQALPRWRWLNHPICYALSLYSGGATPRSSRPMSWCSTGRCRGCFFCSVAWDCAWPCCTNDTSFVIASAAFRRLFGIENTCNTASHTQPPDSSAFAGDGSARV